jgi:hypothetical protein
VIIPTNHYYGQLIPKIMNSRIILSTLIIILLGLSPAVWSVNSVTLKPGSSAKAPQDTLQTKANINTSRSNIKHSTPRSAETGVKPGSSAKAPQDTLQTKANINTSRSNTKGIASGPAETGVKPGSSTKAPQDTLQTKANINTSRSNTKGIASGPAETGVKPGSSAKAPQDTLQTKANINTSRSNIKHRQDRSADIGVNEPGVNLVQKEPKFKVGADLAEKVSKRAMKPGHSSFDVILKNGGASLAMFEQNGYTYLDDNSLLLADQNQLKILVSPVLKSNLEGEWKLIRASDKNRTIGAGQVTEIVKLKHTPVNERVILLEAERIPPGQYLITRQPADNRLSNNQPSSEEWEFCYQYLPSEPAPIQQMDVDRSDGPCPAPGSVSASGAISLEVVPVGAYKKLSRPSTVRK